MRYRERLWKAPKYSWEPEVTCMYRAVWRIRIRPERALSLHLWLTSRLCLHQQQTQEEVEIPTDQLSAEGAPWYIEPQQRMGQLWIPGIKGHFCPACYLTMTLTKERPQWAQTMKTINCPEFVQKSHKTKEPQQLQAITTALGKEEKLMFRT